MIALGSMVAYRRHLSRRRNRLAVNVDLDIMVNEDIVRRPNLAVVQSPHDLSAASHRDYLCTTPREMPDNV
jgi:hypothetical protein